MAHDYFCYDIQSGRVEVTKDPPSNTADVLVVSLAHLPPKDVDTLKMRHPPPRVRRSHMALAELECE